MDETKQDSESRASTLQQPDGCSYMLSRIVTPEGSVATKGAVPTDLSRSKNPQLEARAVIRAARAQFAAFACKAAVLILFIG
jgi:hypothetical protein